ncbi:14934_t:CDS:2, partial [Acaulospora morrowiae]
MENKNPYYLIAKGLEYFKVRNDHEEERKGLDNKDRVHCQNECDLKEMALLRPNHPSHFNKLLGSLYAIWPDFIQTMTINADRTFDVTFKDQTKAKIRFHPVANRTTLNEIVMALDKLDLTITEELLVYENNQNYIPDVSNTKFVLYIINF